MEKAILDGIVNLLNAVYSSRRANGYGFTLIHKITKEEIPIRNNDDLCRHLNTLCNWGIFNLEDDFLSFTNANTEESIILATYEINKWEAY